MSLDNLKPEDFEVHPDRIITNKDEDFTINEVGFSLKVPDDSLTDPTAIIWERDGNAVVKIGTYYNTVSGQSLVTHSADRHRFEVADQGTALEVYHNQADDYSVVDVQNLLALPVHTDSSRDALNNVTQGMVIWNQDDNRIQVFNGSGWDRLREI